MTGSLVVQVGGEPARGFVHGPALATRVVLELVAADAADAEVVRLGAPEVEAGDRRRRQHRERLGEADPGARLGLEQREQRRLLGVFRAGRVAGGRSDALIPVSYTH